MRTLEGVTVKLSEVNKEMMSDTLFPDAFYLNFEGRPGRVNWIRRLLDSPYVECGVTYVGEGGGKVWVLRLEGEDLVPLFPLWEVTETEKVTLIETLERVRVEVALIETLRGMGKEATEDGK